MGIGQTLDRVTEAYRTGGGVAFSDYGPHMMHGQGAINRPAFTRDLVPSWIGAVDGLTERLNAGATIADLGSGVGWASIAMAGQLPGANVIGWDTDAKSIAAAGETRRKPGWRFASSRPTRPLWTGKGPSTSSRSSRPSTTCRTRSRCSGRPGRYWPRAGWSWWPTRRWPAAMAEQPSAAIGTVIRAPIVHELARAAGFGSSETLDVDAGFFLLHVLRR